MQLYWFKKSIPELSNLSDDERRHIWAATLWKPLKYWQTWVVAPILGLLLGLSRIAFLDSVHSPYVRLLVIALVLSLIGLALRPWEIHMRRKHLPEVLARRKSQQ